MAAAPVATSTVLPAPAGENSAPVGIRNQHSNLCRDEYNWATAPGAEVRQWTCTGNNAQRWSIA